MNNIDLKLERGPFQNNGASPWFARIPLGEARQVLKFNLDTGVNYNWVTSSLCAPERCVHHGGLRFDCDQSRSLVRQPESQKTVDFGSWGAMTVESGHDQLWLPNAVRLQTNLYLSKDYGSRNFEELDWDGGIGLPCGTEFVESGSSLIVQELFDQRILDHDRDSISLTFNTSEHNGVCRVGEVGNLPINRASHIFIEWDRYTAAGPKYEFVWSGQLDELRVGSVAIAKKTHLCLDTGSSGFKGEERIVTRLLAEARPDIRPITLQVGKTDSGKPGKIELSSDCYSMRIEAGKDKGSIIPQFFTDVPMPELLLVGSILLDLVVAQFEYRIERTGSSVTLHPNGIHLYNPTGGGPIRS